jgi:PncC family amidohydrolase
LLNQVTARREPTVLGDSAPFEVRLNQLLIGSSRLKVAAAESCTGGEVAHRITEIPGSSDYFMGSVVSYSNEAKANILGVSRSILETRGAVSDECARAMAEGATRIFGADIAVSTTGIAGPSGATARKPVGLVYIAVASQEGTSCTAHHFPGSRKEVIEAASETALRALIDAVEHYLREDAEH